MDHDTKSAGLKARAGLKPRSIFGDLARCFSAGNQNRDLLILGYANLEWHKGATLKGLEQTYHVLLCDLHNKNNVKIIHYG